MGVDAGSGVLIMPRFYVNVKIPTIASMMIEAESVEDAAEKTAELLDAGEFDFSSLSSEFGEATIKSIVSAERK